MLKNMKIKMSLIMGFSVTILVSLAIVITSLVVMNIQSASYQKIIDTNVRASALVRTCRLNANMAARALRDVALDPTSDYVATASGIVSEKLGELEKDLSGRLGRKVKIAHKGKKGRIELEYYNEQDMEALLALLQHLNGEGGAAYG